VQIIFVHVLFRVVNFWHNKMESNAKIMKMELYLCQVTDY